MCNIAVIEFFIEYSKAEEFKGKRILEVGSKYINGSVRPFIQKVFNPKEYIGVDIEPGKYVDLILPAEKLTGYFGEESFDVVISTELLEHVRDWRLVVNNMKNVLRTEGYIYITTRSKGFPYHGYPFDFWRYSLIDMGKIFSDFNILILRRDHEAPGVFLKAQKPDRYKPNRLDDISLHSIILGRRTKDIPDLKDAPLNRKLAIKILSSKVKWLLPSAMLELLVRNF